MKYEAYRRSKSPLPALLLLALLSVACGGEPEAPDYPEARRVEQVDVHHGVEVRDPYRWLEDADSEETRAFALAQDALTESLLGADPRFEQYRDRLLQLQSDRGISRLQRRGERVFYIEARLGSGSRGALRLLEGGSHRTLLDSEDRWPDSTRQVQAYVPDRNGEYVVLMVSDGPGTPMTYRVLETASGRLLEDEIPDMTGGVAAAIAWADRLGGFFYTAYPVPEGGSVDDVDYTGQEVRFHRLGTPVVGDPVVYSRPDQPEWRFGIGTTHDDSHLVVTVREARRSVAHPVLLDLTAAAAEPLELDVPDSTTWSYLDDDEEGYLFFTRFEAPRGRVVRVDPLEPDRLVDVIPEGESTLSSIQRVGERLVATYLVDARREIHVFDRRGEPLGTVDLSGIGGLAVTGEPHHPVALVRSWHVGDPGSIWAVDTRELDDVELLMRPDTGIDPDDYVIEQVTFTSADGTRVPMSLVRRADLEADGSNPVFMYGYGAWSWAAFPYFQIQWHLWVETGGIFAVPNIRGGGEYGEEWHRAGIKLNKHNAIADMIAGAEWLADSGWSSEGRIVANGGSASGLLGAAVAMDRPALFGGAVIDHPSLDLIRAQAQPGGQFLVPEYGSIEDPEEFEALLEISPYHRAESGVCYPPMLVTVGEADRTTVPMHGLKFVAAVQHATACAEPVLLEWVPEGGHLVFGTTPQEQAEILARQLVFARRSTEPRG